MTEVVSVVETAVMSWPQVVVLSIVQGLTEFLPVSSSGHLALVSRLFFAGDAGASFTAVTQIGTEIAVLVYFAKDIARIATAWLSGVASALAKTPLPAERRADYRMGWYVIVGSIPIVIVGVLFQHFIRGEVRNLWVIASAMVGFSLVIAAAEYVGRQQRHAEQLTVKDGFLVGAAQCLALIPGVSRSGATISAGLFLGMDRALAARFGFLLGIPAVFASGLHELPNAFNPVTEGMSATGLQLLVSVVITFVVGYAAISWLLRFVSSHTMYWFVGYRVIAGTTILVLLATGVLAASS